ncbi:MAG: hypothetical protein U1F43_10320 [Myxococcota bacterium]
MTPMPQPKGLLGPCIAVLATLVFGACGEGGITDPRTIGGLGGAQLALEMPLGLHVTRVDYTITETFLEETPPLTYLTDTFSSVSNGGEATRILPCHTVPGTGQGLNEIDISADVWMPGLADGKQFVTVRASAVYTCHENADALVNITLNLIGAMGDGFGDVDAIPLGTLCSGKIDFKPDTYLGVCPTSTCGDNEDVFLFASTCQALQAETPTFWLCGSPTDWQVNGPIATSFFSVPEHDGAWSFGVTALDGYRMAQADPTLTDELGNLTVWTGASALRASMRRVQGHNTEGETTPIVFEFAAELELAAQGPGQPAPHLLLLVNQELLGAHVFYQTRFGLCDVPADDVTLYPGLRVVDARRDGPGAVRLILASAALDSFASLVTRCEAACDTSGAAPRPTLRCGAPTALVPTP